MTMNDNQWQWMTASSTPSDHRWQRVITSDNEWQLMTGSGTWNENNWEQIK